MQELIAPGRVFFFDSTWDVTTKPRKRSKRFWAGDLSKITRIDSELLSGRTQLQYYCVARKMSWASRRETTRSEDSAYCLFGLFDVNMPLLYGEGSRAFVRLQEEIMRSTADLSILGWRRLETPYDAKCTDYIENPPVTLQSGVLAQSAANFLNCGSDELAAEDTLQEFSITNMGIKIRTKLYLDRKSRKLMLTLRGDNCGYKSGDSHKLAIWLLHLGRQRYVRVEPDKIFAYEPQEVEADLPIERYLLTKLPEFFTYDLSSSTWKARANPRVHSLQISSFGDGTALSSPWPSNYYDRADQVFFSNEGSTQDLATMVVSLCLPHNSNFVVRLIALGWAGGVDEPRVGLVRDDDHGTTLVRLQEQMEQWDNSSKQFASRLDLHRIPRTITIHEIWHETGEAFVITALVQMKCPTSESWSSRHYKVTLVVGLCGGEDVPVIQPLSWA